MPSLTDGVSSVVAGFKDLGLATASVPPPFTLREFGDALPSLLDAGDAEALVGRHAALAAAPWRWLFEDDDCGTFVEVVKRLLQRLVEMEDDAEVKEEESLEVEPKPGVLAAESLDLVVTLFSRLHLDGDGSLQEDNSEKRSASGRRLLLQRIVRNTALDVLRCLSIFSDPDDPWTRTTKTTAETKTAETTNLMVESAKELEESFLALNGNGSVTELLIGRDELTPTPHRGGDQENRSPSSTVQPLVGDSYMRKFLRSLTQPYLTKDRFARHCLQRRSFLWVLESVDAPHLGSFQDLIFPPTFCFLDSFEHRFKILGVRCLNEILQKIPASDILTQNRHLVITKSLLHQMNFRNLPLMQALHPCILVFIERYHMATVKRKNPEALTCPLSSLGPSLEDISDPESPRNQFFAQLLQSLELETRLDARRELLRHVGPHARGMGVAMARFLKRTVKALIDVLLTGDDSKDTARLLALSALCDVIRAVPERVPKHAVRILNPLLQLGLDLFEPAYPNSEFTRDNVTQRVKETLTLLAEVAPERVRRAFDALPLSLFHPRVREIVRDVEERMKRTEEGS